MPDILDQSQVDTLLKDLNEGEVTDENTTSGPKTAAPEEAKTYDFKRPERVSKDQMRALDAIHEGFARIFGASLSGFLRTIIEVRVASSEQLTYSEFIHSLPNPTCFNLLEAPPLEGQMCLEISPLIIYPILDRLMGGGSAEMFIPQRALTAIEDRLVHKIIDRALENLNEIWGGLVQVDFKLTATESNPHLVQIVAPNEVVVVISFEIKMGQRSGTMSLCIPFNVIEPVMSTLAAQSWLAYSRKGSTDENVKHIAGNVKGAQIEVRALLAQAGLTVKELLDLQPGDVIRTDRPANSEVVIEVERQAKYAGRLGKYRNHRAVKVTRRTRVEERF